MGVPEAREGPDDEQQARWLLAYLLDCHRREDKADWWEFFRLCELPDEDLFDEPRGDRRARVRRASSSLVTGKKSGKSDRLSGRIAIGIRSRNGDSRRRTSSS